jgi:hypothetical protein
MITWDREAPQPAKPPLPFDPLLKALSLNRLIRRTYPLHEEARSKG